MSLVNLHNHTIYSDGRYNPEEIIKKAIKFSYTGIGFSDHFYTSKVKSVTNIKEYFNALAYLKNKYKTSINVYIGLEIDFSHRTNTALLINESDFIQNNFDYLLIEYLCNDFWDGYNVKELIHLKKNIPSIPIGLAHTFFTRDILPVNKDIADILNKYDIFVELCSGNRNSSDGQPNYLESKEFIIKNKNKLNYSIGTDTHYNLETLKDAKNILKFIKENDLSIFIPEDNNTF